MYMYFIYVFVLSSNQPDIFHFSSACNSLCTFYVQYLYLSVEKFANQLHVFVSHICILLKMKTHMYLLHFYDSSNYIITHSFIQKQCIYALQCRMQRQRSDETQNFSCNYFMKEDHKLSPQTYDRRVMLLMILYNNGRRVWTSIIFYSLVIKFAPNSFEKYDWSSLFRYSNRITCFSKEIILTLSNYLANCKQII